MRILSISTDRKIFEESNVRDRMIEYGHLFEELHIIVFSLFFQKLKPQKISNNVWIYPTNSFSRWLYIFDAIRIGKRIKDINLITTQDPFETGLAGYFLSKKNNLKLHLQVHTDFLNKFFFEGSYLNCLRIKIADFLIPQASGLRVVSYRIRDSLLNKYPDLKIHITILPIFTENPSDKGPSFVATKDGPLSSEGGLFLHKKYPQFNFIILMASRLEKEKNIGLAIEIIKDLPAEVGLVIVGEGGEKDKLKRLAKQLKLSKRVIFKDWSNNLSSYYKSANLFLLTSNYEGYGLTLIESAMAGCPIVTTNVGLVGNNINENNAYVCEVGGKGCLTKSILTAINNENLRKALGDKAQREVVAQNLTKEEYLRQYFQSYQNL